MVHSWHSKGQSIGRMAPPALLHNFRAKAVPKSSTSVNIKDVFSNLLDFLAVWSLVLAHIFTFLRDILGHGHIKNNSSTTTVWLFGQRVTLDIDPSEFPSEREVMTMEQKMPSCCMHDWFRSVLGYQLHYRFFIPDHEPKPKALIIWMHGLQGLGGEAHRQTWPTA